MQSAKLRPLRSLARRVFEQHPPISKAEKLGENELKKKIFRRVDFDASFLLRCEAFTMNEFILPSCFLCRTNFPIHNSTRPPSQLDSVCWRQKLSWREMFSVFWNLFAFTGFVFDVDVALSCIGFSQHQRLFSKSCFANMWTEFFKTNLGHKISFISVIIINSTYLSLTLHKVCFCFAKLVNEKTLHVRLDSTSRRYVCLSCLISSCTFYFSLIENDVDFHFYYSGLQIVFLSLQWLNDKRGGFIVTRKQEKMDRLFPCRPIIWLFAGVNYVQKLKIVTNGSKHLLTFLV